MSEKVDKPITTYKGFNKGLKCHGMQYKVGETYTEDNASVCASEFHACERPLDVFEYYPPATSRYCEVQQSGDAYREFCGTKIASTRIKIGTELDIAGLVRAQIKYVKEHTTNEHTDPALATAGHYGAATAGNRGAATAGDYGAATARGSVCVGENGCGLVRGDSVRARGGIGAILVICEENADDFKIREWKAVVVDGETIKADTWYKLKDGELVEVPENDA